MTTAPEILQAGIDAMADRAATRDQPDGERSMARAVAIYHAATGGTEIRTERDGWLFMVCLKLARAQGGGHNPDDYVDGAAYFALAGETAERDHGNPYARLARHYAGAQFRSVMSETEARAAERPPEPAGGDDMTDAGVRVLAEIVNERQRQIYAEGWTTEHDDSHQQDTLAKAAACYALPSHYRGERRIPGDGFAPPLWPWDGRWWKPKDRRRDLVRAAALIVAEIERLDRAAPSSRRGTQDE